MHDKAVHIFYGTGAFLGQATVSQHLLTPIWWFPTETGVESSSVGLTIIVSQSIEHFWLVAARRQDQYSAAAAHTRAPACRKSRLFMALGEFYGLRSLRSGLCKRQSRWGKEAVGQLGRKRAVAVAAGIRPAKEALEEQQKRVIGAMPAKRRRFPKPCFHFQTPAAAERGLVAVRGAPHHWLALQHACGLRWRPNPPTIPQWIYVTVLTDLARVAETQKEERKVLSLLSSSVHRCCLLFLFFQPCRKKTRATKASTTRVKESKKEKGNEPPQ